MTDMEPGQQSTCAGCGAAAQPHLAVTSYLDNLVRCQACHDLHCAAENRAFRETVNQQPSPSRNADKPRASVSARVGVIRIEIPQAKWVCPGCGDELGTSPDAEGVAETKTIATGQARNTECPHCGQPVTVMRERKPLIAAPTVEQVLAATRRR